MIYVGKSEREQPVVLTRLSQFRHWCQQNKTINKYHLYQLKEIKEVCSKITSIITFYFHEPKLLEIKCTIFYLVLSKFVLKCFQYMSILLKNYTFIAKGVLRNYSPLLTSAALLYFGTFLCSDTRLALVKSTAFWTQILTAAN